MRGIYLQVHTVHTRDVNWAERFDLARPAKFFGLARHGSELLSYYKICKMVYKYYCILELRSILLISSFRTRFSFSSFL